MQPIVKFNNGVGAILCNKCRVIIKEGLTNEEWDGKTDLLLCRACLRKKDIVESIVKTTLSYAYLAKKWDMLKEDDYNEWKDTIEQIIYFQ